MLFDGCGLDLGPPSCNRLAQPTSRVEGVKIEVIETSIAELQRRMEASPFTAWLGIRIRHIHADHVEFVVPWRDEFIGTPHLKRAHGGLLAALVDSAAGYTLIARAGTSLSTVDLRVDFHRAAVAGDLTLKGTPRHVGRQICCVDVEVLDVAGSLVASGRGTFYLPGGGKG